MSDDVEKPTGELVPEAKDDRADWGVPRPAHIPRPTVWPAATAFGTTLFFWGLITSPVVFGVGVLVLVVSLAGWIGEMRHEQKEA